MATTLPDLITAQTSDEILTTLLGVASALGLNVTAWQAGSVARTIFACNAAQGAALSDIQVTLAKSGFRSYAAGDWLALLADQVYNVQKQLATSATGTVTLSNASGGNYTINAGDLHVANSVTGKTYRSSANVTVNAGSSADVAIVADEVGTASDAAAHQITVMVTSLVGVTVDNADAVLGSDDETDLALAQRCLEKLGSLSPDGPKEAYAYVAKNTTGLASPINRVTVYEDKTNGNVLVYLANASGAPAGGDVTIVNAAIHSGAEPLAVTSFVYGATNNTIAISYTVWISSAAYTSAQVQAAISARLTTYFSSIPIGGLVIAPAAGKVYIAAIAGQIWQALPDGVIADVSVTAPGGDVAIATSEVPKLGALTPTVNFI